MKIYNQNEKGFTLIELLVVSTIIVVLSSVGIVSYANVNKGARDAKRKSDLDDVRTTLLLYRSDNGRYPIAQGESERQLSLLTPRKIIAGLKNLFEVPEAFAANPIGYTPPPVFEESTATPNPIPTSTPGVEKEAYPYPTPDPDTKPQEASAYETMTATLVTGGYLNTDRVPMDPINDYEYYYGYLSDGSGFELTAKLEKTGQYISLTD